MCVLICCFFFFLQASAQYFARKGANILMGNVNAIQAGRVKNAHCVTMNVRWPIAMVTVIALVASANACAASRANSVKKVRQIRKIYDYNYIYMMAGASGGGRGGRGYSPRCGMGVYVNCMHACVTNND